MSSIRNRYFNLITCYEYIIGGGQHEYFRDRINKYNDIQNQKKFNHYYRLDH